MWHSEFRDVVDEVMRVVFCFRVFLIFGNTIPMALGLCKLAK